MKLPSLVKIILATSMLLYGSFLRADDYDFLCNQLSGGFYNGEWFTANIKHPPSPIFWTASTHAENGVMLSYQRMIYHTQKYFSINIGISVANWQRSNDSIQALSGFFSLRFWPFHTEKFNPYIHYSIAGPTFISQRTFGPAKLGENFLFQDMLGVGLQIGKLQALNLELNLVHYSNGDIFPHNNGFDVPIVFAVGYSF